MRVSQLIHKGVLRKGDTCRQWIAAYTSRLREEAAGRVGNGELNIVDENAKLSKAKREAQELKNALTRGEQAPIELLTEVLAEASKSLADRIEALPVLLKRSFPDMPIEQMQFLQAELSKARNEWANSTISLTVEKPLDERDSQIQKEEGSND
jgi:phage terminase Nu1 subunit (DNA packaging protein)